LWWIAGPDVPKPYPPGCWMMYLMLPNFACICPSVDSPFSILSPMSPAMMIPNPVRAIFLCDLIQVIFVKANHIIPPINAVLDSVMMMAAIRMKMIVLFNSTVLFVMINFFMDDNLCLMTSSITGRNAIRKYP